MNWLALLLMLAAPFWEAEPPEKWSDLELAELLNDSPWAQAASGPGRNGMPVQVYLATAAPIRKAEQEVERRARLKRRPGAEPPEDPLAGEYRAWMEENRATQIILAIRVRRREDFSDQQEVTRMEKETVMRVGRRKIQITGHFPPYGSDPYLRLAFPREVELKDKKLIFELYVPGVAGPYRVVEFNLKDMVLAGRLEL